MLWCERTVTPAGSALGENACVALWRFDASSSTNCRVCGVAVHEQDGLGVEVVPTPAGDVDAMAGERRGPHEPETETGDAEDR